METAAWAVTAPLAGLAAARIVGFDRHPVLSMGNAGTPFVYLPAYGAAAVGLATRRRGLTAVAGAVAVAHLAWTAPETRRRRPLPEGAATATRIRLATANIRYPSKDSTELGDELTASAADLLFLQELSPEHLRMLKATGLFDRYPYCYVDARHGSFGAGIWSRYPLSDAETWDPGGLPMVRAVAAIDGTRVRLFNIHCKAPMRRRWIRLFKEQLDEIGSAVAAGTGPAIVAGDFNATYGLAPFRRLLHRGRLRDAHVDAGRGLLGTTWPRGGRVFPPLFRIDHVLVTDGIEVVAVREGRGPGSDHRPVIADLAIAGHRP